jgi:hypothetical protein
LGGERSEFIFFLAGSGREKECKQMFSELVLAMWDQRQMAFILL